MTSVVTPMAELVVVVRVVVVVVELVAMGAHVEQHWKR